jgi:hypothetical protein
LLTLLSVVLLLLLLLLLLAAAAINGIKTSKRPVAQPVAA